MSTTTSADGTTIAYDRTGDGPPVVLVAGAFGSRSSGSPLSALLAGQHTVVDYDRRGRNESGDTQPYAVEREVEDLAAVIEAVGGSAAVYGISSGGVLCLHAAAAGVPITRLAVYEPPFILDDSRPGVPEDYVAHLDELIAAGRRGDAVEYFMTAAVRMPAEYVAPMRDMPMWAGLEAVAHTLAYDGRIMGTTMRGGALPVEWATIEAPALVIDGGASEGWQHNAVQALADLLPRAQRRTLEGQTHDVDSKVLAPALLEFYAAGEWRDGLLEAQRA